jgi:hemerythrin-like domain-containing protein
MAGNFIEMLKEDHKKVRQLFVDYDSADQSEKKEIADKIFMELDTHAQIEEQLFYPALEETGDREAKMVEESLREHQEVKDLIAEMRGGESEEFDDQMKMLAERVEHHVQEEESKIFPDAQKQLDKDEIEALGTEMEDMKQSLTTSMQE